MLKPIGRFTIRVLMAAGLLLAPAGTAMADGPGGDVTHCAVTYVCTGVHEPGTAPTAAPTGTAAPATGGGPQTCSWNGKEWPCWDDDLGWFSEGCYYRRSSPQPPAGDQAWEGHDPSAGGAVYDKVCRQADGGIDGQIPVFLAQAPGGPPPDNPAALAKDARDAIRFDPPTPHLAPTDGALVGLPVWLWYDWAGGGAAPAPSTVRGNYISVTATPTVTGVRWDLGDGHVVDCGKSAGTPYKAAFGKAKSPDCGYVFTESSAKRASGAFAGTVTVTWEVTARVVGTNQTFAPIVMRAVSDPFELKVGEVQVLN
ncbi:hypothetical protein [Kitasatospora sp. NPDC057223]|uniref:hypothetical protein n=1 Tax=Kitasatospora sp. NPDC057223 TaxID=3346055 RepID=UPI00363B7404